MTHPIPLFMAVSMIRNRWHSSMAIALRHPRLTVFFFFCLNRPGGCTSPDHTAPTSRKTSRKKVCTELGQTSQARPRDRPPMYGPQTWQRGLYVQWSIHPSSLATTEVAGTPPPTQCGLQKNPRGDIEQCRTPDKVSTTSQFGTSNGALHCSMFPQ